MTLQVGFRGAWLKGDGPESDIVFSTRLRLARNVQGFRFRSRMNDDEEFLLDSYLKEKIVGALKSEDVNYVNLDELTEHERMILMERHLISPEMSTSKGPRGVAFNGNGSVSIMVNEEDHLRIQVMIPGLALREGLNRINFIDDTMSQALSYSFDTDFGYLTACPTNVGTGLRMSVMLHLPALGLSKHIKNVFQAVSKVNLAVRGFFGEGSQALGDFYQISNHITLGISQEETLCELEKVVPKVVEFERKVRRALMKDDRKVLEDKIWRAIALLRNAHSISSEETMVLLSSVKMGIHLGVLDDVDTDVVNKLFLETQPGHLQRSVGRELKMEERGVARAALLRKALQVD